MSQCTAKSKRSGQQCKRSATRGRNVCNLHGGKSPRGIAHPSTTHGRYSRDLPARLAKRYEASIADQDLLNLRREIAVVDARIGELLSRVDSGESGRLWVELRATWRALTEANRLKDQEGQRRLMGEVGRLISQGHLDHVAWAEIGVQLDRRRKLNDSEARRQVSMQNMITAEKAMVLLSAVSDTVKRHVHDPAALAAIAADIGRLVDGSPC
jgi:hypothetical protein